MKIDPHFLPRTIPRSFKGCLESTPIMPADIAANAAIDVDRYLAYLEGERSLEPHEIERLLQSLSLIPVMVNGDVYLRGKWHLILAPKCAWHLISLWKEMTEDGDIDWSIEVSSLPEDRYRYLLVERSNEGGKQLILFMIDRELGLEAVLNDQLLVGYTGRRVRLDPEALDEFKVYVEKALYFYDEEVGELSRYLDSLAVGTGYDSVLEYWLATAGK